MVFPWSVAHSTTSRTENLISHIIHYCNVYIAHVVLVVIIAVTSAAQPAPASASPIWYRHQKFKTTACTSSLLSTVSSYAAALLQMQRGCCNTAAATRMLLRGCCNADAASLAASDWLNVLLLLLLLIILRPYEVHRAHYWLLET